MQEITSYFKASELWSYNNTASSSKAPWQRVGGSYQKKTRGVLISDLPGCFSAGDIFGEAVEKASDAIALWIGEALASDIRVPHHLFLSICIACPIIQSWNESEDLPMSTRSECGMVQDKIFFMTRNPIQDNE